MYHMLFVGDTIIICFSSLAFGIQHSALDTSTDQISNVWPSIKCTFFIIIRPIFASHFICSFSRVSFYISVILHHISRKSIQRLFWLLYELKRTTQGAQCVDNIIRFHWNGHEKLEWCTGNKNFEFIVWWLQNLFKHSSVHRCVLRTEYMRQ